MTDHLTSTKTGTLHAPPPPLGSVANTLSNQKNEPIDYTADESMIADFMAVLPQLDPGDSSSSTVMSPILKLKGHSNDLTKSLGKFDAFAASIQQQQQNGLSIASALVKKVQQQLLPANPGLSTMQSSPSPPPPAAAAGTITPADYQSSNNKRKRKVDRPSQKRIRGSYKLVSPEQKVMIHEYAEKHGVKAASKLFQVAPSTIASWLYQKPNGERTSAIRNKEAHSRILDWIQSRQANGERVNNRDFHSYALDTMRELTGNPDFAASRSWCSNFLKKYNIQLDSDKQTDSNSAQFRFDSVDENASESSQCYMNDESPTDVMSDDDESGMNQHRRDEQTSPSMISPSDYRNHQRINRSDSLSPSHQHLSNGTDDIATTTTTSNGIKLEQENESTSCPSASASNLKTSLPVSSAAAAAAAASKRLTGTLNRLLHSAVNRPNGQHSHLNGFSSSSSPSASSSTITASSNTADQKATLEMSTQAIETFVQHFDSSFNTMTYFQEKLQQLLVSIAQERDSYRTLYLKEHDRRLAAELRLKESNHAVA